MGIAKPVAERLRRFFERDKERRGAELKRGDDFVRFQQPGPHGTGYQQLSDDLRLDHDLMARYADYEEMDDYPELACLAGWSLVFTLDRGWVEIRKLAEEGREFWVLAYDRELRSLVPARARNARVTGARGHVKPMVRVVLDDGRAITCTADHKFMLKTGEWKDAGDLVTGDRLKPGVVRIGMLNGNQALQYWQVHQPDSDARLRNSDGKRWMWVHRLVGEAVLGANPGDGSIVHHKDDDPLNNTPENLSLEDHASHADHHIADLDNSRYFPEWTDERRRAHSRKMLGNTFRRGTKLSSETRRKLSEVRKGKPKTAEHRCKIGEAHKIKLTREQVETALNEGGSVAEAARILGVSWSTARRRAAEFDLLGDGRNHRVLRVEPIKGGEQIYDLEVPGYHNFVCEGVVVHNSAADVFADDATIPDMDHGVTIWATSEDHVVRAVLEDLLEKRLRADEDIWPLTRNTAKYGNTFGEPLVSKEGVVGINYLPTPTVRRVESKKGTLIGFVQDPKGQFNITNAEVRQMIDQGVKESQTITGDSDVVVFEPMEMVHWRLQSKQIRSPYGHGVFEPARWLFRRLAMFEDSALVYKLTRSPARYAYYVDVGDLPAGQAMAYVNYIRREFKKRKTYNPSTGFMNLRNNPLGMNEDIWLPMRAGQETTRVDVLSGPDYQVTDDLEYFRGKLFSAMKVPRSYLGFEPEASRAALSQIDVRFARTIMRIQREIRNGFKAVARIHLAVLGIDPDQVEWDIHMTIPSHIFELAQLELRSARMDLADRMKEWMPQQWTLEHVLKHSKDDSAYLTKDKQAEERERARREAQTQAEIIRDYPEAVQAGAGIVGGEEPAMPPAGGVPPAEGLTQDDLVKILDERLARLESRLMKLDEIGPKVEDLRRDMRFRRSMRRVS